MFSIRIGLLVALREGMIDHTAWQNLFRSQRDCAHLHQLLEIGCTRPAIARRRRSGALVEVLPCVFVLGTSARAFETLAMAAQLQARPEGFLSGFTAAALRGMSTMPRRVIFVTVPRRLAGQRPDCHQRTSLPNWVVRSESNWHDDDQVELSAGFRLEEPHSMMFTLAAHMNDHRFERSAEEAWNRRLITPNGLANYVDRYRRSGRSGVSRCLRWLDRASERERPMQSNFEVDLLHAVRSLGLPEPAKQHPLRLLNGELIHLDLAWPDRCLAVEPGHSLFHDGNLLSERDRRRDVACNEIGWLVMRFGEAERSDLAACAARVARTYRTRRPAA